MDKTPGIRPHTGLWHRLDVASRYAFPAVLTAVVLILLAAPFGLPGQAQMQPAWAMASIFFWTLFRPAAMPAGMVFLLGLLMALIAQGPIGIQVLILLLVHGGALSARRILTRTGFVPVWASFAGFAAAAAFAEWALVSLLTWRVLPLAPALFEWGMATGAYPFLSAAFTQAHRSVAAPERAR